MKKGKGKKDENMKGKREDKKGKGKERLKKKREKRG